MSLQQTQRVMFESSNFTNNLLFEFPTSVFNVVDLHELYAHGPTTDQIHVLVAHGIFCIRFQVPS